MINRERQLASVFNYLPEEFRSSSEKSPIEGVERIAKELLVETKQWGVFPVEPEPIAARRLVKKIGYDGSAMGLLIPTADILAGRKVKAGFIISSRERRFTIAHEVGHTFFYRVDSIGFLRPNLPKDLRQIIVERFCDNFARELLIPSELLEREVSKFPKPGEPNFGAHFLMKLANLFDVPIESMARRLVEDLGIWEAIIFQLEWYKEKLHWGEYERIKTTAEWFVPFESDDYPYYYPYFNRGLENEILKIAEETVVSPRRVFEIESEMKNYLSPEYKQKWEGLKKEKKVLLFSATEGDTNQDIGIQLPLFSLDQLPYLPKILCIIPL